MKLDEIADRINRHLKRWERDPVINAPYQHKDMKLTRYCLPVALRRGNKVIVKPITYQIGSMLSKAEAEAYLAWIEAGNVGTPDNYKRSRRVAAPGGRGTMTADEINAGLAKYLWPEHKVEVQAESDAVYVVHPNGSGFYHRLFTDSLDACSRVADKLGVRDIEMQVEAPDKHWCGVHAWRFADSYGPTRAHALAAALYAAVEATNEH